MQVGSRLVLQTTGILMIVLGIFGKFGAVFITIPDPVIGGMFLVMFGMIAAVGISNLQVITRDSTVTWITVTGQVPGIRSVSEHRGT